MKLEQAVMEISLCYMFQFDEEIYQILIESEGGKNGNKKNKIRD